jgi:hypothetical protein
MSISLLLFFPHVQVSIVPEKKYRLYLSNDYIQLNGTLTFADPKPGPEIITQR